MSESPPPTQVPLRESLLDPPRARMPSGSPNPDPRDRDRDVRDRDRDLRDRDRDSSPPSMMGDHASSLAAVSAALTNGHPGMVAVSAAHANALGHPSFQMAALVQMQHFNNMQQQLAAHHHHHRQHQHNPQHGTPLSPMALMRKGLPGHLGPPKPVSGCYSARSPPPPQPPCHPFAAPPGTPDSNACKLIKYRERDVAAFLVDGRELICLPQAFDLFLKELVGGLHTVYTKLKRLDIQPIVCNVEQVRVLRGLGAIQPGVNRCKLISCDEFDVLYDDCTNSNARPGRPPKRSPSIHASPETIEKLKKTRMEGPDFGGYDPRYFAGDHKALMNGFSNPFLAPYMHMGVNTAGLMPPHAVNPNIFAASQFAMRAGAADHAASSAKDAKAYLDHQDIFSRHGQDGLGGFRMFAAAPPLPPDVAIVTRHADVDPTDRQTPLSPDKPINLSNVNGRGLPPPPSALKHSDDEDDDESINDEKITSDDNDMDADNSNDSYAQHQSCDEMDSKPVGRPDLSGPLNVGQAMLDVGQGDLGKVLLALIELGKQAYTLHAASKQSRFNLHEKDDIQAELRRQIHLRQEFERKLKEQENKNEVLEMRCRRLKKQAVRRLDRHHSRDGSGPNSPASSHGNNANSSSCSNNNNNNGGGGSVVGGELGLDLAIKPPAASEGEPARTLMTDAAESESDGDKNTLSDRIRSLSGPVFFYDASDWGTGRQETGGKYDASAKLYAPPSDRSAKTSKLNEHLERIMAKRLNGDPRGGLLNGAGLTGLNGDLRDFYGDQNRNEFKCLDALSDRSNNNSLEGDSDLSEEEAENGLAALYPGVVASQLV